MSKLYSLMKQYSEFQNKEEFNTYQQQILTQYQVEINKTDFLVIRLLGRYAVNEKQKTVGVACPLMETIAVKIEKNIRTVRRSVAKLEQLGIIKRVFTKERHKRGEIRKAFGALLYSTMQSLFLDVALEWGAAARRNSGIVLYNPFESEKKSYAFEA